MNLEKLFELVLSNPDNISILYSNINGEEKLIVNGEEVKDNSLTEETKEKIETFKDNLDELNNCIFTHVMEIVGKKYDLNTMENLLTGDSFNEDSANVVDEFIEYVNDICRKVISERIEKYEKLLERF